MATQERSAVFYQLENGTLVNLNKAYKIKVVETNEWKVLAKYYDDDNEFLYSGEESKCEEVLQKIGKLLNSVSCKDL